MSMRLSLMGLGLCALLAAACLQGEDGPATVLSEETGDALSSYGIDEVVRDGDVLMLLDGHGTQIGTVATEGATGYTVELRGYHAQSSGHDTAIDFACEGQRYAVSRTGGGEWMPSNPEMAVPAEACLDALAVGLLVTADLGSSAPEAEPASGCSTFSGWIWGFDCLGCFASIPGGGFAHTSCSYGWASTSCTRSTCPINNYEVMEVENAY